MATTLRLDPERLRQARVAKALTQQELGDQAGVRHTTVSNLECGNRPARFSTIRKLAAALGVEPAEIADVVIASSVR